MRSAASSEENPTADLTPSAPWRVEQVEVKPGFRLWVRFVDGTEGGVEMERLIHGPEAGVFDVLRDVVLFGRVYLEHGAVTWPGEIDLAPDAMYDAIKSNGSWILE